MNPDNGMEKRALLAVVISLAILILWQMFFLKKVAPPPPQTTETAAPSQSAASSQVPTEEKKTPLLPSFQSETEKKTRFNEKEVVVETGLYTAVFSTHGAALKSWKLKRYKTKVGKDGEGIELITQKNPSLYPLSLYFSDPSFQDLKDLDYELEEQTSSRLRFLYQERGVKIEREYEFYPEKYKFQHDVRIWLKKNNFKGDLFIGLSEGFLETHKGNILTAPYADVRNFIFHHQNKTKRQKISGFKDENEIRSVISWAGIENRYFLSSLMNNSDIVRPYLVMSGSQAGAELIQLQYPFYKDPQKEFFELKMKGYFGPKKVEFLKEAGQNLEEAIDFGIFSVICIPLLKTMNFFYKFIPNYGVAILLLTLLIRILFHPLIKKSYVSMREMQRIQPQIAKVKEKFKENPQQMNKEVMDLMKANKVNPLGGCLPLLIQMPIFFALYRVLYNATELYHAPFFGWILDLSSKDPYYVMPVLMTVAMFFQQKMTPTTTMDPMQQKMMQFMPVIFGFFMVALPSGLVIYILFSTVLQIASQVLVNRDLIKKGL
ncbi:MAG: membrane protein insertase YidC [Deltaproteobacteria bacterium]|nr:membrane protein insertase YidC [Deltaproteobacteria bacterium]